MPPTATEVNARLHKAVTEEGKVLNMEAVKEVIAWLEKINMTMAVLEETRIGRRINLLRKNVKDADLAKRVKNLIKKWKNDMEKVKEKNGLSNDTNNRLAAQPGNLQTLKRNIDTKQTGVKRRLTNVENLPNQRSSSPRIASPSLSQRSKASPSLSYCSNQASPLSNLSSPKSSSSPRLVNQNVSSPKIGKHRKTSSPLVNNIEQKDVPKLDRHEKDANNTVGKSKQSNTNSNGVDEKSKVTNKIQKPELFNCVSKDNDTRVQEDRISSLDSGYHGTLSDENSPSLSPSDKLFLPIDDKKQIDTKQEDNVIPTHFDPIEPEDLEIKRKELLCDPTSPNTEADGINGVFSNDHYYNWTEEVTLEDYAVLPYVILD